jgi:hypothetical protein
VKWLTQQKQINDLLADLSRAHLRIQHLEEECDVLAGIVVEKESRIKILEMRLKSWVQNGENAQ